MTHLESIAQSLHVRIGTLQQLIRIRYHAHRPCVGTSSLTSLEAEPEISRMSSVQTEGVDRSLRISFRVGSQPSFCVGLAAGLELFVLRHLVHFLGHGFDMVYDQFIQITVSELATNAELSPNRKFVLFLQLEDVKVLINSIGNFSCYSQVIVALRLWADDSVTDGLRSQVFLGLCGVERFKEGVLDNSLGAASRLVLLPKLLSVLAFLDYIPRSRVMVDAFSIRMSE